MHGKTSGRCRYQEGCQQRTCQHWVELGFPCRWILCRLHAQPQLASHTNISPNICIHFSLLAFWSQDTDADATTARVPLNVSDMAILLSVLIVHCEHCADPHSPFFFTAPKTDTCKRKHECQGLRALSLLLCLLRVMLPYISYRLKLALAAWNVTGKGLARKPT